MKQNLKLAMVIAIALTLLAACYEPAKAQELLPCRAVLNAGISTAYNGDELRWPTYATPVGGVINAGVALWDTKTSSTQNTAKMLTPAFLRAATFFECDSTTMSPGTHLGRGKLELRSKGYNSIRSPVDKNSVAVRYVQDDLVDRMLSELDQGQRPSAEFITAHGTLVGVTHGWPRVAAGQPFVVDVDFGGAATTSSKVLLRLESAIQDVPKVPSENVWDISLQAGAVLEVEVVQPEPEPEDEDLALLSVMTGLTVEQLRPIIEFLKAFLQSRS